MIAIYDITIETFCAVVFPMPLYYHTGFYEERIQTEPTPVH